jgi:ATP-binding cassette subfamily B protein
MTTGTETDGGEKRRILSNREVLGFVWRQWMRRPKLLVGVLVFTMTATACDLSIPWAAGGLIGAVSNHPRPEPNVWVPWAVLAGLYALFYGLRQVSFRFQNVLAGRNMEDLTNEAFRKVLSFSSDWHADTFAGSTVRKVSRGMWGYDSISDVLVLMLGPAVTVLIGLSISVMVRNLFAGIVTLTIVLLYMASSVIMTTRWVRPANLKSNALDSKIGGALADAIGGVAAIKSFGAEAREAARFAETTLAWRQAVIRTWNRFADNTLVMNVLLVALQSSLTGMVVFAWLRGTATPNDVGFAVTSFMMMAGYLRNFGDMVRQLQKGVDDLEDIVAYERQAPQVDDRTGALAFVVGPGEIAFDHVAFRYKNQNRAVYDGFSLTIAPGERVALVGPTGAGKSTFVKLIQRLYDVDEGSIRIDGQDVASVTQDSLRRAIAVVPQDPALFHRSIAENIRYGRPEATMDEVIEAARRARAHEFIARLPKGYDTLVGERGVKLSGGERQRVAIARAFLADAPILVLDEATSSLDVETEREVQAATEALMAGRTTVVIAHRLSTIRGADRILVFSGGRIVEEGRHGELVAKGGTYARLHAVTEGAL